MPELRVFGVGTYRDVELDVARPARGDARTTRAGAGRGAAVAQALRPLRCRADARRPRRQAAPPDAVVGAIFDETEGNPFFVEEVFRHLAEEGKVFDDAGAFRTDLEVDELDVPESVRLVVGRRLERLGADAQKVLAAGAVVGRGLPVQTPRGDHRHRCRSVARHRRGGGSGPGHRPRGTRRRRALLVRPRADPPDAAVPALGASPPAPAPGGRRRDRTNGQAGYVDAAVGDGAPPAPRGRGRGHRAHARLPGADRRPSDAGGCVRGGARGDRRCLGIGRRRTTPAAERSSSSARAGPCVPWAVSRSASHLGGRPPHVRADRRGRDRGRALLGDGVPAQSGWRGFADAFASYARGIELLGDRRSSARADLLGATRAADGVRRGLRRGRSGVRGSRRDRAGTRRRPSARAHRVGPHDLELLQRPSGRRRSRAAAPPSSTCGGRRTSGRWSTRCRGHRSHRRARRAPAKADELAEEAVDLGTKLGHVSGRDHGPARRPARAGVSRTLDLAEYERQTREELERFASIGSPWVSQSHAWIAGVLILRGDLEGSLRQAEAAIELEPASAWTGVGWSCKFLDPGAGRRARQPAGRCCPSSANSSAKPGEAVDDGTHDDAQRRRPRLRHRRPGRGRGGARTRRWPNSPT